MSRRGFLEDRIVITEKVSRYLSEVKGLPQGFELRPETQLLQSGLIDSLGMVDLVAYLEQSFSIAVDDDDMVPENFETVAAISAFVERKRAGAGGQTATG